MSDHVNSPVVQLFEGSPTILDFDGEAVTAFELAQAARFTATRLAELGLKPGDRVGLLMANGREYVQAFLACAAAGLIAVSVNAKYSDLEVVTLLARSGASLVISDREDVAGTGDGALRLVRLWGLVPMGTDLRALDSQNQVLGEVIGGLSASRCVVFTTSGTTSVPKLVVHTQASVAEHAADIAAEAGFSESDIALVVMPLCGTFGLTSLLGTVAAGCHRVLVPGQFSANATAKLIEEAGVTLVNGSDDMFHRLLESDADLSSIRIGGYARFNTSLDGIVERAEVRGMTLTGLYGMSEVQALFTIRSPDADSTSRSQAGGTITSPRALARVIDGELQLRGPSLFEGYLANGGEEIDSDLTSSTMDDGWFRTGDSATQPPASGSGESREFTFISRLGDVLRIGGFLVAPSEIEQVLMSFPGIERAQVVAVDRPGGARPVAFVTLSASNVQSDPGVGTAFDEAAVKAHCLMDLAKFKVPVRVIVISEFPMVDGPNGPKVQRTKLREMATGMMEESA